MPRYKHYTEYPVSYHQLFKEAFKQHRVEMILDNVKAAKNLRRHLYNFRASIKRAEDNATKAFAAQAESLKFSLDGSKLIIEVKTGYMDREITNLLKGENDENRN